MKKGKIDMDAIRSRVMKKWEQEHKKFEVVAVKHFNTAMALENKIDDAVQGKLGQVSGGHGDAWGQEARHHWIEAMNAFLNLNCHLVNYKKGIYIKPFELILWNIKLATNAPNLDKGWPKEYIKLHKQYCKKSLKVA
jgi:hypothetical protein